MIIELDGSQHYTPDGKQYDIIRTEVLEKYNLKVIRFTNLDVDNQFEGVCAMIDKIINERIKKV